MSLRDKILNLKDDTPSEIVSIPEWGLEVLVKGFTLGAKDEFLEAIVDKESKSTNIKAFNAGVLVGTAYDPATGEKLFTEVDVPILKQKSAVAVQRIVDAGVRLSGLSEDAVEVAAKKSSSTENEEPSS